MGATGDAVRRPQTDSHQKSGDEAKHLRANTQHEHTLPVRPHSEAGSQAWLRTDAATSAETPPLFTAATMEAMKRRTVPTE